MKLYFLIIYLLLMKDVAAQTIEEHKVHSNYTQQNYVVLIKPPVHRAEILLFVTDGGLGLGEFVLGTSNEYKTPVPQNCAVIAVKHLGKKEPERNRDYIPSDISKNSSKNFGQANDFYLFLKNELIPFAQKKFPDNSRKVLLGHSLGGLFCLYVALRQPTLFDKYFAISPSIWANNFELLKIERRYAKQHRDMHATIYIYAGSLEVFNLIRLSANYFVKSLRKRNYPNLKLYYTIIKGEKHLSVRKPALEKIMQELRK
ncbi:MAG: alpha/beta hydrolase [Chitinophagaceae bacterium]|nr:alpha/beta hydrolase [Chitinophagaceae bacterium]